MINQYPYSDAHELNLDWIILKVKELIAAWAETSAAWETQQQAFDALKAFVNDYFDNLDVQQEINNKIDDLVLNGTLSELIAPYVASGLPSVVADQIAAVVAAQISAVVAAQLPAVAAEQLPAIVATETAGQAAAWLETHVNPDTGYVIDDSLTIAGAAADAKAAGDAIGELKSALTEYATSNNDVYNTLGGMYSRPHIGNDHTMLNGNGETQTEHENLKFWRFDIKECTFANFIVETSASGENAHWVNQLSADGTVLRYQSITVGIASNVSSPTLKLEENTRYLVISVWSGNGSVTVNGKKTYGTSLSLDNDYHKSAINALINQNEGTYPLDFIRAFEIVKTDGTTTNENTEKINGLQLFECNNLHGKTTVHFKLAANVTSGHVVHWLNQYDEHGDEISHTPVNFTANTDEYDLTLNSECVKFKISMFDEQVPFVATVNIVKSPIFSKISGLGDSITAGYSQYETVTNTYQKLIANTLGASYQNLGISSTPVCPNSDYTGGQNANAFVYRYSNIASDADLIIIAGGTNDFRHNVPLGTESDTDAKYEETFYGACDYLLKNITATYPNAKVVWVSPFHQMWDTTGNTSGLQLSQYLDAIKAKCRKYGVTFIDAFACSGMSMSASCISNFMPDSIHPNTAGHLIIYKNLMPYFAMS